MGKINSRQKGARGEREWAEFLRGKGYSDARRGTQFSGSPDSPDVVCQSLPFFHFEVKRVQALNVSNAIAQAENDCGGRVPLVAHRKDGEQWLITLSANDFFNMIPPLLDAIQE